MPKPTAVSPSEALARYLGLGPGRSLVRLHDVLTAEGNAVHGRTLSRWSSQDSWQDYARLHDAVVNDAEGGDPIARALAMNDRQAALGHELQEIAAGRARELVDEGYPLTPADVAKWVQVGSHLERLATGQATSRNETNIKIWGEVLVAVAALFETVVKPALRADQRELVARELANGLNDLRDATLHLPAADDN